MGPIGSHMYYIWDMQTFILKTLFNIVEAPFKQ